MNSQQNETPFNDDVDRRKFMSTLTKALGSTALFTSPAWGNNNKTNPQGKWTVGQIMDRFISEVPGAPFQQTVDTLKSGDRSIAVTGIVTTMFATINVIEKAIALKANFIIAHEPTFYNHLDETDWLKKDEVYQYKAELLKKNSIALWRNHDYIHRLPSDGVKAGVVAKLAWEKFPLTGGNEDLFDIPQVTLEALIGQVKQRLGIPTVRYVGDLSQPCKKVLLMPGASGGRNQILAISKEKPDAVLCGEVSEWETAEYIRDARSKGQKISLVVLGHIPSEEPGSEFLASWLRENIKGVNVTHVPAGNSLMFA